MRPPRLIGDVPKVKADWQWSGEWWVTTDAVLTGAWRLPKERRLLLLFVNVGDEPVTKRVENNASGWGMSKRNVRCEVTFRRATLPLPHASSGAAAIVGASGTRPPQPGFEEPVTFSPREVTGVGIHLVICWPGTPMPQLLR